MLEQMNLTCMPWLLVFFDPWFLRALATAGDTLELSLAAGLVTRGWLLFVWLVYTRQTTAQLVLYETACCWPCGCHIFS